MTSFADLGAWLPRSGKWCFLVGSGISLPAGIPSVSTFLPTFFMHLWPAAQARLCEFAAMGPHGTVDRARLISRLNAGQYLRFEGVMAAVSRHVSAADYTQLLQCFDHSTPARAHRLLATLLDRDEGHTVFTTNFDTLIERARQPSKACVAVNEAEYQSTETGLFKLHGTVGRWNATAQTVDPAHSEERPAASIDEVGQIRHSHSKRKRFLQVLANSEIVVVAGYSAGDVFDITAWLKESRPQKLLWIDHAATRDQCPCAAWHPVAIRTCQARPINSCRSRSQNRHQLHQPTPRDGVVRSRRHQGRLAENCVSACDPARRYRGPPCRSVDVRSDRLVCRGRRRSAQVVGRCNLRRSGRNAIRAD
jgi:hypothetical protein